MTLGAPKVNSQSIFSSASAEVCEARQSEASVVQSSLLMQNHVLNCYEQSADSQRAPSELHYSTE